MTVKLRRTVNSDSLPTSLELGTQQAGGITVDNYSGYWLQVGNFAMFVPPYTIGWAGQFDGGSVAGSVTIRKSAPSTIVTNPPTGQNDTVIATLFDEAVSSNLGIQMVQKPIRSSGLGVSGQAQGTSSYGVIPTGLHIINAAMSAINRTAGAIGDVQLEAFDTAGTIIILLSVLATPTALEIEMPLNFVPLLNPALEWQLRERRSDRVGVGSYDTAGVFTFTE